MSMKLNRQHTNSGFARARHVALWCARGAVGRHVDRSCGGPGALFVPSFSPRHAFCRSPFGSGRMPFSLFLGGLTVVQLSSAGCERY